MTISSSLNAGVAGLFANASRLSSISDNIANSSTFGYKRVETDFHSLVASSGKSEYSAGGVRVTNQRLIDEDGSLSSTSNSTDIAVRGRGFLPVTPEGEVNSVTSGSTRLQLTTTGSFRTNSDGLLRTATGQVLLGWPANPDGSIPDQPRGTAEGLRPVQINFNAFTSEPTTEITLGVNLPASDTDVSGSGATRSTPLEYFDNLGASQTMLVEYTPDTSGPGRSNSWTMVIRDQAQIDPITGVSPIIGEYTLQFDESSPVFAGTLTSVTQTAPAVGGAYDPVLGTLTVNAARGPISMRIGALQATGGLTQYANDFAPLAINKNGSPIGQMSTIEVDEAGFLIANFDSGITQVLYQIPLVDLPNANGLIARDNQVYEATANSGSFYLWNAGDGPTGDIIGFALEESTTDVAGELTDLITTQRAYSSNAKVIQTVDEMLQETTNIKR